MLSSDLRCAVLLLWAVKLPQLPLFCLTLCSKIVREPTVLLPWPCSCHGASAALHRNAGSSRSCFVPGQAFVHGYGGDLNRSAAKRWPGCCLRPQKGRLRSAPWQAKGSPGSRCPKPPQVLSGGSRHGRNWPCRPLCPSVLPWAALALGSCAPFLFVQPGGEQPSTRRRTG